MFRNKTFACLTLLIILCGVLFFYKLGDRSFWDPDEPRYAQASYNMLKTKDYITPMFNGSERFDKPPLIYWLIAASYKVFGVNEFAARLPSAFGGLLIVILCFLFVRKYVSQSAGFISGCVLATCLEFIVLALICNTDMVLAFFICLACVIFYVSYKKRGLFWINLLFYLLLGISVLTKGPVSLVVVGLVILVFLSIKKDISYLLRMNIPLGLVILFFVITPWFFVTLKTYGLEYFQTFFVKHNFSRFTSSSFQHAKPFYYFLVVTVIGFLPWSFFILPAFAQTKSSLKNNDGKSDILKFCVVWFSVIVVFFTFSKAKLPTYILGSFVPLSIIVGIFIEDFLKHSLSKFADSMFNFFSGFLLVVWPFVGVILYFVCKKRIPDLSQIYVIEMVVFMFIVWLCLVYLRFKNRNRLFFTAFIVSIVSMKILAEFLVIPKLDEVRSTKLISNILKAKVQNVEGYKLCSWAVSRPSFVFYMGQNVKEVCDIRSFEERFNGTDTVLCLIRAKKYNDLKNELDKEKIITNIYEAVSTKEFVIISNKPMVRK